MCAERDWIVQPVAAFTLLLICFVHSAAGAAIAEGSLTRVISATAGDSGPMMNVMYGNTPDMKLPKTAEHSQVGVSRFVSKRRISSIHRRRARRTTDYELINIYLPRFRAFQDRGMSMVLIEQYWRIMVGTEQGTYAETAERLSPTAPPVVILAPTVPEQFACTSDTCRNAGTCINHSTGYSCSCSSGYGGIHCEESMSLDSEIRAGASSQDGWSGSLESEDDETPSEVEQSYPNSESYSSLTTAISSATTVPSTASPTTSQATEESAVTLSGAGQSTTMPSTTSPSETLPSTVLPSTTLPSIASPSTEFPSSLTLSSSMTVSIMTASSAAESTGQMLQATESTTVSSASTTIAILPEATPSSATNPVFDCSQNPCQNGGSCSELIIGVSCSCLPGYHGIYCGNHHVLRRHARHPFSWLSRRWSIHH